MKTRKLLTLTSAIAAVLLVGGTVGAWAQTSVGVKFVKAGGSYANSSSADALLPAESAGAPGYAQANWNNLGQYGDTVGMYGTAAVLNDSAGAATSLSMMWDSGYTDNSGQADSTPDQKLMDGYIADWPNGTADALGSSVYYSSGNNKPLAYVGNLQNWYQAQGAIGYKVVLYVTTSHPGWNPFAQGYVESVTGNTFWWSPSMVEGSALTPPLYASIGNTYSGTYTQITSTNSGSTTWGSCYMVFNGLTNDAVLIRLQQTGGNAGISGFQIVPIFASQASIGGHFVSSGGNGIQDGATYALAPAALAGASTYAQTNWNNLGNYGDYWGSWGGTPVVLKDESGAATSVQIGWDQNGTGSTGTGASLGTANGYLMDGFITTGNGSGATYVTNVGPVYAVGSNDKPLVNLSGLSSWLAGYPGAVGYNVVLYYCSAQSWNTLVEGYVNAATGSAGSGTLTEVGAAAPPLFGYTSTFGGTFVPATSTNSGSPTASANYMVFTGLTNDNIVIHEQMLGWQGAWNGFQIVPIFGGAPTASAPTFSRPSPVYAGMPVTLAEAATPNPANTNLWYQWQTDNGAGGPANNNIPDATNATYAFTPANSNANYSVQFQVVVTNVYGAVTSSVVAVAVVPVPTNGQWTACYQMTNASQPSYNLYGSGSYTGTGVLGTNGFWNPVNGGAWNSVGPFTSASDYEDNGSTHSGITCTIGGQSFVGGTQSYSASDVRGLLSQFVTYYAYSPNAIVFSGVPNGTYNLALHGTDGQWGDHGTTFTVHGANGDQTAATTNKSQYQYFVDKDTTVIITNVQVSGGTLNVDVTPTSPSSQCQVDAVEIQLVSLSAPSVSTDVSLSYLALDPLGALTPTFNTTVTNYTANEANGNSLVTVTVTNTSSVATNVLFLNGAPQATNAGSLVVASLPLVVGSGNMIQVVVTAQDGVTTSTNTVTVTRAASSNALLASLTITPAGTLAPAFASGTTSYNATNTYVNNPVTVTATSADGTATLALSLNGGAYGTAATGSLTSGSTNLLLNPPVNTVAVQVVSQDLSQTNVYTVNVLLQPSQSVPKLTNSVSGNNLVLSWPADHLGYRLLVQTNNLNKGVSGNINDWGTVSGSQSITATNLTIIKTGVTNQYYKLVYP